MKVLWVTNMWPDDRRPWYGSFVFSQAQSLRDLGVELDVVYIPGYRGWMEYPRAARAVQRAIRFETYDVVHAHYGHSAVVAAVQQRVPLLISYCGADLLGAPSARHPDRMTLTSRSLAMTFAQASRLAAATVTKSEAMARRLPRSVRTRNHVIPNGVDVARFAPQDRDEARRQLGWMTEPNVLFVGDPRLPRKNLALAAAVCAEVRRRGIPVELRVACGLPPNEVPLWLNASDLLLFPSLSEGSPNAIKEAMAVELPIVSAPVGDVPERLHGVEGTFVVQRDVRPMADAVVAALAAGRAPAARAAVLPLRVESVAERVLAVYREIAR